MAWQQFSGPWGTHVADPAQADAWALEAVSRLAAYNALDVKGPGNWTAQRTALVSAWTALSNAYKAANVPPSSDPRYRETFTQFYGKLETTPEYFRTYKVGPLVSRGGGRTGSAFGELWRVIGKHPVDSDHQICAMAVRLSLSTDGNLVSTCLEATGPGDCDYRSLFTGCASWNIDGIYSENDCNVRHDASTAQWHDPPGSPQCMIDRCSPPLRWSADILHQLLDAWTARGGALQVIDAERSFVTLTNFANASLAGLAPRDYITAQFTANSDAAYLSTGNTPVRATTVGALTTLAAICASQTAGGANVYADACVIAAAVAAVIAELWPVAVGQQTDALGVPLAVEGASAAFLPAMIATPDAAGNMPVQVPAAPGTTPGGGSFRLPSNALAAASATLGPVRPSAVLLKSFDQTRYGYANQRDTIASGNSNVLLLAGLGALALLASGKGFR